MSRGVCGRCSESYKYGTISKMFSACLGGRDMSRRTGELEGGMADRTRTEKAEVGGGCSVFSG